MEKETKTCPFCGEEILAIARKCKHCGEFLDGARQAVTASSGSQGKQTPPERTLWEGNPSHFYYLVAYVLGTVLLVVWGLGLIVIIWALLDRQTKVFTVTTKRVKSKSGIISRATREVVLKDVRSINLKQGIVERLFGLGTVEIGSAGTAGIEVTFTGIPEAPRIKDMIAKHKDLNS